MFFFFLPQLFSLIHCACTLLSFLFFIQHFVLFRWLSILFITRFTTLQGVVYVGALLAISGPIIRFFKRPLFFSFSLFFLLFSSLLFSERSWLNAPHVNATVPPRSLKQQTSNPPSSSSRIASNTSQSPPQKSLPIHDERIILQEFAVQLHNHLSIKNNGHSTFRIFSFEKHLWIYKSRILKC